jgi:hypothetical protein
MAGITLMETNDLDFCREFIEKRRWQFARTQPWNPHQYTIKLWLPEEMDDFYRFATLIATQGFTAPWGKRSWPYLDIDEHTYYTFGDPLNTTSVINRKLVEKVEGDRNAPSWKELTGWVPWTDR